MGAPSKQALMFACVTASSCLVMARGDEGCHKARKRLAAACGLPHEPAGVLAAGADVKRSGRPQPTPLATRGMAAPAEMQLDRGVLSAR